MGRRQMAPGELMPRRRYALVGCGARGIWMYARPLVRHYTDVAELVALCDTNRTRMAYCNQSLGTLLPAYTSIDEMLAQVRPDVVIVASIDRVHHEHIIASLEAGCDVITEKPLTIDDEKCRAILAAERRTGR